MLRIHVPAVYGVGDPLAILSRARAELTVGVEPPGPVTVTNDRLGLVQQATAGGYVPHDRLPRELDGGQAFLDAISQAVEGVKVGGSGGDEELKLAADIGCQDRSGKRVEHHDPRFLEDQTALSDDKRRRAWSLRDRVGM